MTNSATTMAVNRPSAGGLSTASRPGLNPATDLVSSRRLTIADRLNPNRTQPRAPGRVRPLCR